MSGPLGGGIFFTHTVHVVFPTFLWWFCETVFVTTHALVELVYSCNAYTVDNLIIHTTELGISQLCMLVECCITRPFKRIPSN